MGKPHSRFPGGVVGKTLAHTWGHECSKFCIKGGEWHAEQERWVSAMLVVGREFTVYGDVLEQVKVLDT